MPNWQQLDSATDVADKAVELINKAAKSAIEHHGSFSLVLAGGSTPLLAYRKLAMQHQQWNRWQLYYGDERCLPVEDSERNSQMVKNTGLTKYIKQHFIIPAELGSKIAAQQYKDTIKNAIPFDMVILGIGEDGHTASLFPDLAWPQDDVAPVSGSPKPPSERVTLGAKALQNCHNMLILITGENKKEAVQAWQAGEALPISKVCDMQHCHVLIERSLINNPSDHV